MICPYTVNQENLVCRKIQRIKRWDKIKHAYKEKKLLLSLKIDQIDKFYCSQIKMIYSIAHLHSYFLVHTYLRPELFAALQIMIILMGW